MWNAEEVAIKKINELLNSGYEVEVDSPDGFVPVSLFVDKGEWDEYLLTTSDSREIRVNENHLFETNTGWKYARDLIGKVDTQYISDVGLLGGIVTKTGYRIPIVDIQVDHENHRYYTNGISSHNTGVGKSLFMCHCAAGVLTQGKNVLYITMEMAEERIAERIDANLLNITMDELKVIDKDIFDKRIQKIAGKTQGKLIVKEYPTAGAHAGHFRALLEELKMKREFLPDIIYIDYLNICASQRMKQGGSVNSYTYIKSIAEELRGLAVEYNVPIMSATQTTRSGFTNSNPGLEDTSECIWVEEPVTLLDGSTKRIGDIIPGDQIISNDGYKTTMFVHHTKPKDCIKLTLKSGKTITVSKDHIFPTSSGRKSINTGLVIGDILNSM